MSKYGVVVLDETFEQDDWSYCGIIKANHDVYFDVFKGIENDALDSFDDSSDSSGSYGIYQNVSKSTLAPFLPRIKNFVDLLSPELL